MSDLASVSDADLLASLNPGLRNNNPTNLRGQDGQFRTFASRDEGMSAGDQNLQAYGSLHGIHTLLGVTSRWAPKGDGNNDPVAYANWLSKQTGIGPNEPIDLTDAGTRQRILPHMASYETGVPADAAPAAAAPTAGPPAADLSQVSDQDLLSSIGGNPSSAGPQAGPGPTIKSVNGRIVFGDSGLPVSGAQEKTINTLAKGGLLNFDRDAPAGSVAAPFVQRAASDKFAPGAYYISAGNGHLARMPGGPDGGQGGFLGGFYAGAGDVPNTVMKLIPGNHDDSDVLNAMEAHRAFYDANTRGDTAAAAGRFTGQVAASLPLMGGIEAAAGKAALRAPSAVQPLLEFLAGRGGTSVAGRVASQTARDALAGGEAAGLTSGASDDPLALQVGEGMIGGAAGGRVLRSLHAASGVASRFRSDLDSPLDADQLVAAGHVAGKLPAGVTAETLNAADPRLFAGEAMGQKGQVALAALARGSGDTGDMLGERITARREGRGHGALDAISQAAGIEPDATRGAVDRMVERGQQDAEPHYLASFTDQPVWSPTLEKLSTRPSVKTALKGAVDLMREENNDPDALGVSFVEDPSRWAREAPPAGEPQAAPVGFAGRASGPARAPSRGPSLAKFIADTGGIRDDGGEISAIGGDRWHVGKPYQRQLIGQVSPEDVAQKTFENGYFPARQDAPSPNELVDALDGEMRGKALYAREGDAGAQSRFDRANAAEELSYRGGNPADVPHPDDYTGSPAPVTEPAHQMQPKTQTWDYIKRSLDDELKPYFTGKLEWTDQARLMNQTRAELVNEVASINPRYRQALDVSGDYLSSKQAFQDGRDMILNDRVDQTDFGARLRDMTPKQRRFLKAGIANKAYNLVVTAQGQPTRLLNAFKAPVVRTKLAMAMGQRKADALVAEIDQLSRMKGFEDRYGPRANSVSSEILGELGNINGDNAPDTAGQAIRFAMAPKRSAIEAIARVAQKGVAKVLPPGGLTVPQQNEAGAMLTGSPQDLAMLLQTLQARGGAKGLAKSVGRAKAIRGMIGAGSAATRQAAAIAAAQGRPDAP